MWEVEDEMCKTDPRYVSQMEFCQKNMPDYPLFKVINMIYKVAPGVAGTRQGQESLGIGRAVGTLANIT